MQMTLCVRKKIATEKNHLTEYILSVLEVILGREFSSFLLVVHENTFFLAFGYDDHSVTMIATKIHHH